MHCAASHSLTLTWIVVCLDFYADSFDFRHVVVAGLAAWSTHNFGDLQLDIVVVLSQDLLNCPDIFTKLIHFSIYGLNIILAIYKHVVGTSAQNLRLTEIKSMLVMKWFFRVACCWAQKKILNTVVFLFSSLWIPQIRRDTQYYANLRMFICSSLLSGPATLCSWKAI